MQDANTVEMQAPGVTVSAARALRDVHPSTHSCRHDHA